EFPARGRDTLYLSLPAWSPGAYEIQNYARYVRHFSAKNPAGQPLFWDRFDKDTWRVTTAKSDRVTVEFDYLADTIDLSLARINGDFGQFLGTNLFLYEEGQLQRPAEVRFSLPAGWQVTTALKGSGTGPYTAPDYHELVDAETFVGKYSLDSLQVDGKWIRPAEMRPYDYHGEQYTPLLWWSEGVTDYYADLANVRSGLWTPEQFLNNVASDMQQVESAPEPWSEEDGSVATWINEIFVNSSQLYYPKGALTGMLLDIAIRDATDNKSGLDEVTRALYARFYQRHKGFTTADLLALLREFGMPDVDGFYQRYVNGREPLPYEAMFSKAGIAVTRK